MSDKTEFLKKLSDLFKEYDAEISAVGGDGGDGYPIIYMGIDIVVDSRVGDCGIDWRFIEHIRIT